MIRSMVGRCMRMVAAVLVSGGLALANHSASAQCSPDDLARHVYLLDPGFDPVGYGNCPWTGGKGSSCDHPPTGRPIPRSRPPAPPSYSDRLADAFALAPQF